MTGWLRASLPTVALIALVVAATWPAWRLAVAGAEPSARDLLQLQCGPAKAPGAR